MSACVKGKEKKSSETQEKSEKLKDREIRAIRTLFEALKSEI